MKCNHPDSDICEDCDESLFTQEFTFILGKTPEDSRIERYYNED